MDLPEAMFPMRKKVIMVTYCCSKAHPGVSAAEVFVLITREGRKRQGPRAGTAPQTARAKPRTLGVATPGSGSARRGKGTKNGQHAQQQRAQRDHAPDDSYETDAHPGHHRAAQRRTRTDTQVEDT